MNHRISLTEFVVTLAIVIGVAAGCYHWLAYELVALIETSFNTIPH